MKPDIWWLRERREGPCGADLTDRTSSPSPEIFKKWKEGKQKRIITDLNNWKQ